MSSVGADERAAHRSHANQRVLQKPRRVRVHVSELNQRRLHLMPELHQAAVSRVNETVKKKRGFAMQQPWR